VTSISASSSISSSGQVRLSPATWILILILSGAAFVEGLNVSMMGVSLPSIQTDLTMTTSSLQWVISAYVLGFGGFMLLGGRTADLLGRRSLFLGATAVFIAFSALGGLATEGWMLIGARFVAGVAAAFMTPAALSIITTTFTEGDVRNKALLVYSGAGAAGFASGTVIGGLLTELDWRLVFYVTVLFSAVILAAGLRFVPRDIAAERTSSFDIGGAVTVTGFMVLLVYAIVNSHEVAWTQTAALLAASAITLATFIGIERRHASPLVRLGIFTSTRLLRANAIAALFVGGFAAFQFVIVLYLQQRLGWSAIETGLALLPGGIDAMLAPLITPILIRKFGVPTLLITGTALATITYVYLLRLPDDWNYWLHGFVPIVLIGIGFAIVYGPVTIAATDGIADHEQGLAGGLVNSSFQFGAALALAAATLVLQADGHTSGFAVSDYRAALLVPVVAVALGLVVSLTAVTRPRHAPVPEMSAAD
jgi:MFS family permease